MPPSHGLPGLPSPELRALRPGWRESSAVGVEKRGALSSAFTGVPQRGTLCVEDDMLFVHSDFMQFIGYKTP